MNEILRHYVPQNDIGQGSVIASEAKHLVLRTLDSPLAWNEILRRFTPQNDLDQEPSD